MGDFQLTDTLRAEAERDAERGKERKLATEQDKGDWGWLMGTPRGRRIVWRLLERAAVFQSPFTPNAMELSFATGKRHYGGELMQYLVGECPDQFVQMLNECRDASRADKPN